MGAYLGSSERGRGMGWGRRLLTFSAFRINGHFNIIR